MRQKLADAGDDDSDDELRAGSACFCRWGDALYGGKILSVDESEDTCRVHFLGWAKHHDGDFATEYVRPAR